MASAFQDKVRRPLPVGLERKRLEEPLLSLDSPSLITVVAPAGAGKTTLLARVAAMSPIPVAWYLAAPEDNSVSALSERLAHALANVLPVERDGATIEGLVAALELARGLPMQLVIDDAHVLKDTAAERALERFLRLRPSGLRVAVGSRRPLAINAPRLLVAGELMELDSDALRFRYWEVEDLFRSVYREPLRPEAAAALTRQTGGWAAGLKLFHLSTSGKSDLERSRAVAQLTGRSKLFRSYLTWNVLEELDPERRRFLLYTSTLGRLTGPLCDALLERTGSATILDELERLQFFTVSSEDGSYYRYHQVLQNHLEGLLVDELGVRAAAELHSRSARLLEDAGHLSEAMRACALADDWGGVARLVQQSAAQLTLSTQSLTRLALPEDDPWLTLVRARRMLRTGSIAPAVSTYRRAESLLDDADFVSRCAQERALAAPWLPDAVVIAPRSGDHPATARAVSEALRSATRRATLPISDQDGNPFAEGIRNLLAGRMAEARAQLLRLDALRADVADPSFSQLAGRLTLVMVDACTADRASLLADLEEVVLSAEVVEQTWLARLARGLQAAALLASEPTAWRIEACAPLVEESRADGDKWGELLLSLFFSVAQLAVGNYLPARNWADRAAALGEALDAPVLVAWGLRLSAHLAELMGLPEAAGAAASALVAERNAGLVDAAQVIDVLHSRWMTRRGASRDPQNPPSAKDPEAESVYVRAFGNFQMERAGATLALTGLRPRSRALLLLLAMHHGRNVHREVLIEALWPEAPFGAATHRLQVAASNVRQCLAVAGLGAGSVVRHGDAYSLVIPEATFDIDEFEEHLRAAAKADAAGDVLSAVGHRTRAVEVYVDELLPEVGPSEWVVVERDRLRIACAEAANQAADSHRKLGQLADGLAMARRAISCDPMRDSAWRLLAEIQEDMGDRTAAEVTRREFRQLCHELGVAAPEATVSATQGQRPRPPALDASRGPA